MKKSIKNTKGARAALRAEAKIKHEMFLRKLAVQEISKGGKIFSVVFEKKDGSIRKMTCRTEVAKYTHGGVRSTAHKPNIVGVYDLQAKGYRSFDVNRLKSITGRGKTIDF